VDWWVIFKAPKLSGNEDTSAASGMGYAYGDAKNQEVKWMSKRIDTSNGALESTLNQIYDRDKSVAYIMYNDQPPNTDDANSYAHAKGVMAFENSGGFWLVHSVPNFPALGTSRFSMPDNSYVYGQSFMCVSLETSAINDVAGGLLIDKPFVYSHYVPSSLAHTSDNFAKVLAKQWVKTPTAVSFNIATSGGFRLKVFAKNKEWKSDLYSKLITPALKTDIYVETWMNGEASNKMPTYCAGSKYPYSVINVAQVSVKDSISWPETADHSKWAISTGRASATFCVGDINRQDSQANRGGGMVCGVSPTTWSSIKSFITKSGTCKGYNHRAVPFSEETETSEQQSAGQ